MNFLGFELDECNPPVYVAEISANHDNDLETVFKMIDAAKESMADVVKVQMYNADEITSEHIAQKMRWNECYLSPHILYNRNNVIWDNIDKIWNYAFNSKISIFATVYGLKGLTILEHLGARAYKIASFENEWDELLLNVILTNKPTLVSSGMLPIYKIMNSPLLHKENVLVMHCISSYPCSLMDVNLARLAYLNEHFDYVGYSDHTVGTKAAEYATILGAKVIEKHFTLTRQTLDGAFSATPDGFKQMVMNCNHAWRSLWNTNPMCEHEMLKFKRSIWVIKEIAKGDTFNHDNIAVLRPSGGLSPKQYDEIINTKVALCDLKAGQPLKINNIGA